MAKSFVKLINPLMDSDGKFYTQVYGTLIVTIASHVDAGSYIIPITNVASVLASGEISTLPIGTLDLGS